LPLRAQTIEWSSQFGAIERDEARAVAADATGVYSVGYTRGILPDLEKVFHQDGFIRKFAANGNVLWTRQFGTEYDDEVKAVAAPGGALYIAGDYGVQIPPTTEIDADKRDGFLSRYTTDGTLVWTRRIQSTVGTPKNDSANAVAVDASGIYVAGGTAGTLAGQIPVADWDGYLRKYDAAGNLLWTRQFGSRGFDEVVALAVNATGIFVLGQTDGAFVDSTFAGGIYDIFLRKYDSAGTLLWARQFGTDGSEFAGAVVADADGIYISGATSGRLPEQVTTAGYDAFLRRYDNAGNVVWTRQFSATRDVLATSLALDVGALFLAGNVFGTLPGQAGGGGANEDVFVRKYDLNGNPAWTRQFGAEGADFALGVAIGFGGLFIAGSTPRILLSPEPDKGDLDALVTRMTTGTPTTPVLYSGAAVNGASFRGNAPVAPGSIASVFGLNLSAASLGAIEVRLNGINAPVFAATPTQINFQVPWQLAGQQQAQLVITVSGTASNTITVPVAPRAPGIFTLNSSGSGHAVALIGNSATLAAPPSLVANARPAGRGEFVTLFATGLGAVNNQPPTGVAAPVAPLAQVVEPVSVTIGGVAAPVSFAGLAPGFFGLYQINVQMPAGLAPTDSAALVIQAGGVLANPSFIAVR
jgi:uncharacterized protein (TIGR03437 family)